MIGLDLTYHRPTTSELAVQVFQELYRQGQQVLYYAGGTEIITLGRAGRVFADSLIDLKGVPETKIVGVKQTELRIGSNVTLTDLTEQRLIAEEFPLLSDTAREIADRTSRNKITFGGNLCGRIIYREAVLPLLVSDSRVFIAGQRGIYQTAIHNLFRGRMRLQRGEFVVGIATNEVFRRAPYVHIKRRKMGSVGYPIVTATAIRVLDKIRVALSGVCDFPFRWWAGEEALNRPGKSPKTKVREALRQLPGPILDDEEASREYRVFVLEQTLVEILGKLGG